MCTLEENIMYHILGISERFLDMALNDTQKVSAIEATKHLGFTTVEKSEDLASPNQVFSSI